MKFKPALSNVAQHSTKRKPDYLQQFFNKGCREKGITELTNAVTPSINKDCHLVS